MRKLFLCIALVSVMAIVFSACSPQKNAGNSDQSSQTTSQNTSQQKTEGNKQSGTNSGGVLKIGEYILDTQLANKNPFATSGTWLGMNILVYEPLLYFNPVDGKLLPALADEYKWNDDYTNLTLRINKKAKWHDGKPLTTDDVVFTFEILKNNAVLDRYSLWKYIDKVDAQGDNIIFTLSKPFISLPFYLSEISIVPKHIWEKTDPVKYLNETPIGTGPFIFKKYNTGTDIQFEAFKDYWRGAPKVDSLVVQMYNSSPNVTLALLKGDIQCTMGTIAMPNVPEFLSKPGAKMQVYAGLTNFSVLINHEKPLLNDVNVRKAMAMAINQKDLITKGEYNGVFPTSIGWLPDIFGELASKEAKNMLKYDPQEARKVLESAGYTKGTDGIYQKDGKRLSFTYHNASGAPAQQMEAGMIQQWLLNIGIEIIPKLATWPELTKLAQSGSYDLLQMGVAFPPDPFASLNTTFNSAMTAPIGKQTPGTNYIRFRNSEVDALLGEAASVTDPAKQKEIYHKIQNKIASEYPLLPMYNVGGHIPYHTSSFTGWDESVPVYSPISLIKVHKK